MKILFIGDIVGKASRKKIKEIIPTLKSKYNTDMIIANGENATSGYGLSKKDAEEFDDDAICEPFQKISIIMMNFARSSLGFLSS